MDFFKSAISEYEDTLIDKRKSISTYYFSYEKAGNMKLALQIMKYAFETYLCWSPQELRDCLSLDVMDRLKIRYLLRYIVFPPELDSKKDLFFIAWKIYPHTVHYSDKELILRVYQNLLDNKIQKYPKEFFTGSYGMIRAEICLQYMIEQHLQFRNVRDVYSFFSSHEAEKTLKLFKLNTICRDLFDSPLEYLHNSLPKEQQQPFLYHFYYFKMLREVNIDTRVPQNKEVSV